MRSSGPTPPSLLAASPPWEPVSLGSGMCTPPSNSHHHNHQPRALHPSPQVQRLLRAEGLLGDGDASGKRRRARDATERARLLALYQRCRAEEAAAAGASQGGEEGVLGRMAERMPELGGGAKQVRVRAGCVGGWVRGLGVWVLGLEIAAPERASKGMQGTVSRGCPLCKAPGSQRYGARA